MFGLVTLKEHARIVAAVQEQWFKEKERDFHEIRASRDQWRELALEALADLRELRKVVLAPPGEDAVPGMDPKTTREADLERARQMRERQDEEAA